eukprot:3086545-Rhodomonas_salina.1
MAISYGKLSNYLNAQAHWQRLPMTWPGMPVAAVTVTVTVSSTMTAGRRDARRDPVTVTCAMQCCSATCDHAQADSEAEALFCGAAVQPGDHQNDAPCFPSH